MNQQPAGMQAPHPQIWPAWRRWFVVCFFLISSSLNYLDRLLLASLAPVLKAEYHLTNVDYGNLVAAFSVTYAVISPVLGLWMDRSGLTVVAGFAVGAWSLAGMATAYVRSATELLWVRVALGVGEAGGIPGTGKVFGTYLLPKERALGAGVGQFAISAGSLAAPLLSAWALRQGRWQEAFVVAGALGLVWVAGWLILDRAFPVPGLSAPARQKRTGRGSRHQTKEKLGGLGRDARVRCARVPQKPSGAQQLLRDSRYWRLLGANFLWMSIYTLWPNWTTLFLTSRFGLTTEVADHVYAWLPPLGAAVGALAGGVLSGRWIRNGAPEVASRLRVCFIVAVMSLVTAFVPFADSPTIASVLIGLSYCFVAAGSANLYTIPVDLYGAAHSGFAVAGFVSAFGVTQFVFNPIFGRLTTSFGDYRLLCLGVSVLPLLAYFLVAGLKTSPAADSHFAPLAVSGDPSGHAR